MLTQVLALIIGVLGMALCALFATYWLWLPWVISVFAAHNFLITSVEENTGKWIKKGAGKRGRAWRFITPSRETDPAPDPDPDKSWNIEQTRQPIHGHLLNAEGEESWFVDWIDRKLPGSIRWIGLPFIYSIHEYNFRWEVQREGKPGTTQNGKIKTEDGLIEMEKLSNDKWVATFAKRLDYIYLRDAVYYFEVIGAETKAIVKGAGIDQTARVGMPLEVYMLATIRVVNPYRALFLVHDWLESTFDLLRPNVRSWIAANSYEDVVGKPEVAEREYDQFLKQSNVPDGLIPPGTPPDKMPKAIGAYIECTYGVREKRIAFDDVIPPEEYTQATVRRMEAEQNRNATITNAEAEREKQTIIAQGEANRIATVTAAIAAGGDLAMELRRLEALESVGNNGNMVVVSDKGAQMLINTNTAKQPRLIEPGKEKKE
ncbi:MAG TPA: SPFH domain-containing protein [Candidatus Paceibacterota bacterium]|nr:SPFH domain-containing protein [Candidatus Paceibacterota bacterium]